MVPLVAFWNETYGFVFGALSTGNPTHITIAILGALIPALAWLWIWLREDPHPEPWRAIAITVFTGTLIVPFVIPFQHQSLALYPQQSFGLIFAWAMIEEIYKYAAALIVVLWRPVVDEPIDYVIYMIAIAIGFTIFENALYMFKIATENSLFESLYNGGFRAVGASLVHIVSSATVGLAMAYSIRKPRIVRACAGLAGLILASILHASFNISILRSGESNVAFVFLGLWAVTIGLILVLERMRKA